MAQVLNISAGPCAELTIPGAFLVPYEAEQGNGEGRRRDLGLSVRLANY